MKKIILILSTLLLVSCTSEVIETRKYKDTEFINLQKVDNDCTFPDIYVDTYTDVLYAFYTGKMSAIMKADGSCLTYTEWKARNK